MDYSNMPDGYEPPEIPFQPSPPLPSLPPSSWQDPYRSASPVPSPKQPVRQQARMPKARALTLVRRMKQGVVVGSLLCFGTVAGLIVNQTNYSVAQSSQVASQAAAKTSTTTSKSTSSTATSTASPTATATKAATSANNTSTSTSQNSSSTSSQASSTQQGGGYGFGSTQAAQPVSSSRTS